MSDVTEEVIELPDLNDPPEEVDHPDEVTDEEALEGLVVYREVDDLDDDSNGILE